jgi:hypothetical protein
MQAKIDEEAGQLV